MLKKAKQFFCFLFLIALSQVTLANSTQTLASYSDLLNALSQGNSVRAIMYVNKCSIVSSTANSKDIIAGMPFTEFNKYAVTIGTQQKNTIATSTNKLIEHSQFGPVYNYVRLRIFEDNSAEIFSEYLDPTTYKQRGSMTANCTLSNGHDQNGILLFNSVS